MRPLLLMLFLPSVALAQSQRAPSCDELAARFGELEATFSGFEARTLGEGPKALKQSLKAAAEEHRELQREYTRIAAARCKPVSIDATVMLGRISEELALKVVRAPPPSGLDEEQLALFRKQLLAQAQPLFDQALAAYGAASKLAAEAGVTGDRVRLARERLKTADGGVGPPPSPR